MALPIVFRRIARRELDESISWYEVQRVGLGLEFAVEVDTFLQRIAETPEQFPQSRGEIKRAVLRRFPYTLHFLTEPDRIVILAVFHVKRNPRTVEGR
jgi:plasmid stabilization system protein ParE